MKKEILDRIGLLRKQMEENAVDVYVIKDSDYHQSEYTGEFFNVRQFMSGFSGSAGNLVVTKDEAALFTDGRYFIQAKQQLMGTGIELMRMGMDKVPTLTEYVLAKLPENGRIGFDGRTVDAKWGEQLESRAELLYDKDFITPIWKGRPALSKEPLFFLEEKYAGESVQDKIKRLREKMKSLKAEVHMIATLDDICWLFNIRGNDVKCNPVVLSFAAVTLTEVHLFIDRDKINSEAEEEFKKNKITLHPYEAIYEYAEGLKNQSVLLDLDRINYRLYRSVDQSSNRVIRAQNPTVLMKAVKNKTEIKNLESAHIKDGLALTRFIRWVKENMKKKADNQEYEEITEISAADYLEKLRSQIEGYIELSFDTISAYGPNAAMMHYSATKDSNAVLKPEGMLLVDSGGQYLEGTTDVTRTICLGRVTQEMKKHFTLTLKGMLNLANAKFLYGCTGLSLDILARQALWDTGMDYRSGTGHGVGYLLNVHEAPNSFRWRHVPGRTDLCVLEEGMVTSDEPGVYIEGEYGIRIENEIVCVKEEYNEYGQFMKFEMLTLAPIDLELIDTDYLEETDKKRLNEYHERVYQTLAPYMEEEERAWLRTNTRAI